jgi:hypothetical protein
MKASRRARELMIHAANDYDGAGATLARRLWAETRMCNVDASALVMLERAEALMAGARELARLEDMQNAGGRAGELYRLIAHRAQDAREAAVELCSLSHKANADPAGAGAILSPKEGEA